MPGAISTNKPFSSTTTQSSWTACLHCLARQPLPPFATRIPDLTCSPQPIQVSPEVPEPAKQWSPYQLIHLLFLQAISIAKVLPCKMPSLLGIPKWHQCQGESSWLGIAPFLTPHHSSSSPVNQCCHLRFALPFGPLPVKFTPKFKTATRCSALKPSYPSVPTGTRLPSKTLVGEYWWISLERLAKVVH